MFFFREQRADGRSGVREVGMLVGMLRKLQGWSFSSVVFEERGFERGNGRFVEEVFVELFDVGRLTLPEKLPSWWIKEEEIFKDVKE